MRAQMHQEWLLVRLGFDRQKQMFEIEGLTGKTGNFG
jgi:hypothetical protein